jgi:hypothetical protein
LAGRRRHSKLSAAAARSAACNEKDGDESRDSKNVIGHTTSVGPKFLQHRGYPFRASWVSEGVEEKGALTRARNLEMSYSDEHFICKGYTDKA